MPAFTAVFDERIDVGVPSMGVEEQQCRSGDGEVADDVRVAAAGLIHNRRDSIPQWSRTTAAHWLALRTRASCVQRCQAVSCEVSPVLWTVRVLSVLISVRAPKSPTSAGSVSA